MHARHLACFVLVMVGTVSITYAWTRRSVTYHLLHVAASHVEEHFRQAGVFSVRLFQGQSASEEEWIAAKRVVAGIHECGGWDYWWNKAIHWFAVGFVCIIAGVLSLFVKRRTPVVDALGGSEDCS